MIAMETSRVVLKKLKGVMVKVNYGQSRRVKSFDIR